MLHQQPSFESRLRRTVVHLYEGRIEQAKGGLDELERALLGPDHLDILLFVRALQERVGRPSAATNLYLEDFEIPQIDLFDLLGRHLPLVEVARGISNDLLRQFMAGQQHAVLVDIGIGSAQQEVRLLRSLAERGERPQRLTVVAIEPAGASLAVARTAIISCCEDIGIPVEFVAVDRVAEAVTAEEWSTIERLGGTVVVNASFAAHHIRCVGHGPAHARDSVLERLRHLRPAIIVLTEPNSDHLEPRLLPRFESCWHHFSTVFRFIDELELEPKQKGAMKVFFGREIVDILARDETTRVERHERSEVWAGRLLDAGFTPFEQLPIEPPGRRGAITIEQGCSHVHLSVLDEEPVVAVVAAHHG